MKVEIVLPDEAVEPAISPLLATARTGRTGDGKVFVSKIEGALGIRSGETGDDAL